MSLSLLVTTTTTTATISSATPENPLRRTNSRVSRAQVRNRVAYTSCDQNQRKEGEKILVTDRRNVLLGMGGLYGAAATIGSQGRMAIGAPLQPPDLSACHLAVDAATNEKVPCCPPYTSADIIDFVPPSPTERLRVRKSARKYAEDLEKFKAAIAEMKKLEPDDPWNYMQQATIHCTYCNGAYDQVGTDPPVILQVHGSWLFLPWHRYYLYFWERILGKLIGDPTFALPFWDWDTPEGMNMPKIYLDKSSPLYNDKRDHNHYDALLDYKYSYGQPNPTPDQEKDVIMNNLRYLYNMFKEGLPCPSLFMGKPIIAGEKVPSQASGSLENLHNIHHMWTGPTEKPYYDMGNFYTTARDTMFFGHHANVDRMWDIYRSLRGGKTEFKDDDWLETSFIFYDENRKVVKCKVKDCLDPNDLGYTYKTEKLEWPESRKNYIKQKKANKKMASGRKYSLIPVEGFGKDPKVLDKTIRVLVRRPKISRSKDDKEDATEVLYINDIVLDQIEPARFDVYISKPIEDKFATEDLGELAGSYVKVPHAHHKKSSITTIKYDLKLGITLLVEDIDADASENLVVSFVPRRGEVTISGVTIELCNSD